jgi:two-component system cell cycle sensor histidine kinase PleC
MSYAVGDPAHHIASGTVAAGNSGGAAADAPRVDSDYLHHEDISRFLEVSRSNFIIEPIASILFAVGLWQYGDMRQIGLWLVLVWALAILRVLLNLHIQRTAPPVESLREWGFAVSAATCLAGGVWASGLLFLWPLDAHPEAVSLGFILTVAIMIIAGAVMVSVAFYAQALCLYLLVTSIVAAICLIWQPAVPSAMAVMGLLAASLMLSVLGWWVNRLHAGQTRLRAELDAAREAANTAHRTKSQFVANISHELRTPLNAINGFSEIIKDQAFGPVENEHYLEYANDIYQSGNRLLEVINDILELSNLETGNMPLAEERVDVCEVVISVTGR